VPGSTDLALPTLQVPELARLAPAEVDTLRKELDGIKVRGVNIPKPVRAWTQCGLSSRVMEVLRKAGFDKPLPIQAQALPIIMSGRDCIGIAKTGSGKTLGFVVPMLRHIKDQRPIQQGDGPVALIMAPTRELVSQITKEVKTFAKPLGMTCVAVFGGSGVANQIRELKRGSEVVACTPGRMIDLLATGSGRITNLRRVTYLVLDEADRMFDMGFEPQIMRIVNNIRPDRQTVLFSATFPRQVEALARSILQDPVEIQVRGGALGWCQRVPVPAVCCMIQLALYAVWAAEAWSARSDWLQVLSGLGLVLGEHAVRICSSTWCAQVLYA
jgi:ATP-dependent RNA helicase DDX46/PRP5